MNWITELGLNKDKQELKNEKHHQGGKCSMLCILRKRALNGCTAHLGTSQRGVPSYSLLTMCRQSEVSRGAVHSMDNAGTTGASPVPPLSRDRGEEHPATRGGHCGAQDTHQCQVTQSPRPPRFEQALVSLPGFVPIPLLSPPGCSWLQQPLGSMRLQEHTSAPSPPEKIKPSGYRDRNPLICHRKNAHRLKIWPVWAGLNSNSITGRAGPSYF